MPAAGEYVDRLQWLQRTKGADSFGDRRAGDTFEAVGSLWGVIEDVTGNREERKGAEKQVTTATIRLRNYPTVAPGEKLRDADGNDWLIKTAVEGDNEVSCEVER